MYTSTSGVGSAGKGSLSEADRTRLAQYADASSFYKGEQWNTKGRPGESRLTVNYARTLLRKVASYVFPGPVTFTVPVEGDQSAANRAERALTEVIAANDLARLDVELAVEAMVLGDAAMKVTWDEQSARPVVAAADPSSLITETAVDNPKRLVQIEQRYGLTGTQIVASLGTDHRFDAIDLDRTYPVVEMWSDGRWRVIVDGLLVLEEPNPYGWIPYVVLANNPRPHAFWGESDLTDLFDICRELNQRMSVLSQVLELSGAPIAVLENVDGSEGISVGPGAKWELPEGARAYLLDLLGSGGVNLHIDYINLLYRALHDLSETPRTAFGDSGRTLSGAALEVEIQPLVQKVARKRRQWDAVYQQRNRRILDLLERFGGYDFDGLRRTTTVWPSVLPSDTDAAVRNEVALVEHGIHSRRTAVANLGGNDPEGELRRVDEETRGQSAKRVPPVETRG